MTDKTVARYEILDQLGSGGMSVVYRGRDSLLGRQVALKFLPEKSNLDNASLDRFFWEARAASALNHPSICTIYDIGEREGRPFLVMEFLEGRDLRAELSSGRSAPARAVDFGLRILEALEAAHALGIVHRDIKPENIFLTREGRLKLLDFGLAKLMEGESWAQLADPGGRTALTMPGIVMGTIHYMSPEQVRGEEIDPRSDLYSLGVVLYEMLTGTVPARGATPALVFDAILNQPPTPPSSLNPEVPPLLDAVVLRSLRKNREHRYRSAAEMASELGGFAEEGEGTNRIPSLSSGVVDRVTLSGVPSDHFPSQRQRHRLVGREREIQFIESALAGAASGLGGMVLIEGEAGIGKTRLLESALQRTAPLRMLSLAGRCSELEGTPPYLPFVEALERLFRMFQPSELKEKLGSLAPEIGRLTPRIRRSIPDLPAPMDLPPEQGRHLLFSAVVELIEEVSRERAVLLALEDLHWADASTCALLEFLAPRLPQIPVLVIATHRPADGETETPFAATLANLIRLRLAARIALGCLDRSKVGELFGILAGTGPPERLLQQIYEVTEGNPFFVEEVFGHLEGESMLFDERGQWREDIDVSELKVPQGIRLLLERRLRRLSPLALQSLQMGAVLGRTFALDLLQASTGFGEEDLIEALEEAEEQRQVVSSTSRGLVQYTFSHALIRRTLLETLSPPRRQKAHRAAARVLEGSVEGGESYRVPELAHHLISAGSAADPLTTLRYAHLAGDQALEKAAFDEALRLYDKALRFGRLDDSLHAQLLFRKGTALTGLTRWPEAQRSWYMAVDQLERRGERDLMAQICGFLAAQHIWTGHLDHCFAIATRGLEALGDAPTAARSRLLAWAGHALNQKGDSRAGATLTEEAVLIAERLNDSKLLGHVLTHRACQSFYTMSFRDQCAGSLRAIELLVESPWDRVEALAIAQLGLASQGELERCRGLGRELRELADRIGHLGGRWMSGRAEAQCDLMESADFDRFERFAEYDLEVCRQANIRWASESHSWMALSRFWRGDWEEAGEALREAVRLEPGDFSRGYDWSQWLLWLAYTDRVEEARQEWRRVDSAIRSDPRTVGDWSRLFAGAETLAWLGDHAEAAELYPVILKSIEMGNLVRFNARGLVETAAAIAAASAQLWERAEAHFQEALRRADEIPHRVEQAEARRWYASMLLRRQGPGDPSRARVLAGEAEGLYEALGMRRHPELLRRRPA